MQELGLFASGANGESLFGDGKMKKIITLTAAFALAASTSTAVLAQTEVGAGGGTGIGGGSVALPAGMSAGTFALFLASGLTLAAFLATQDKGGSSDDSSTTTTTTTTN